MKVRTLFSLALMGASMAAFAQNGYWQQEAHYQMEIDFDDAKHKFSGKQILKYTNHSPDTLDRVYYHLYFNAFQPGSQMDVRSRNIADPDGRVGARISKLTATEQGYQRIFSLMVDGLEAGHETVGTVLKVELPKPILPGQTTEFVMDFEAQVPVQIRRSGRYNKEGIAYSMAQWYPKMAEYDRHGWHPHQYIGREFYGVWGSFDVKINIQKDFKLAGTGVLQNADEIGFGYDGKSKKLKKIKDDKRMWHFVADKVHDFAWAADKNYTQDYIRVSDSLILRFFYTPEANKENWMKLQEMAPLFFEEMQRRYGAYVYPQFSVIQAGDGGMEYPMCTFVVGGGREFEGFFGLFAHETAHNWFYGMLGFNETYHPWMDEGFTNFAEEEILNELLDRNEVNPHKRAYERYRILHARGWQEPLSTPADHYDLNIVYGISTYGNGAIFLNQLRQIIGKKAFDEGMLRFYREWRFKHPGPEDFIRVMEKTSGIELDWYLIYWAKLTKPIDYAVDTVISEGGPNPQTEIVLRRNGTMPMPLDLRIKRKSPGGEIEEWYHIPLVMMYGHKNDPDFSPLPAWPWVSPIYRIQLPGTPDSILEIRIDPHGHMADLILENNVWPRKEFTEEVTEE